MITLTILGLAALLAALITLFISWRWSAAAAFAGMCLITLGNPGVARPMMLIFWGIAAVLVVAVNYMLPPTVADGRMGIGYIAGGALLGTLVGYLIGPGAMVLCDVIGVFLGALAFSRTPRGRHLDFPSSKFIQYLCAKGLPAAVTLAIIAYSVVVITL